MALFKGAVIVVQTGNKACVVKDCSAQPTAVPVAFRGTTRTKMEVDSGKAVGKL